MDFRWLSLVCSAIYESSIVVWRIYYIYFGKFCPYFHSVRHFHFQHRNCCFECDRFHVLLLFMLPIGISGLVTNLQFIVILLNTLNKWYAKHRTDWCAIICGFSSQIRSHHFAQCKPNIWDPKEEQCQLKIGFSQLVFRILFHRIDAELFMSIFQYLYYAQMHTFHMSMIFAAPLRFYHFFMHIKCLMGNNKYKS